MNELTCKESHSIDGATDERARQTAHGAVLRTHFDYGREMTAIEMPKLQQTITAFGFYDLRGKAVDDSGENERGDQTASDLLGG